MTRNLRLTASLIALAAAAFGVAACKPALQEAVDQNAPAPAAALPLSDAAAAPGAPAPLASQLPPAPPLRVGSSGPPLERYAYADRADYLNDAFGDAPPDYAFDDNQVSPWVWRSDDGYTRVVEPLANGDRYYYYEPGADRPFLVRDPDYAYGYDGGGLAVVYDSRGRALADEAARARADYAARYLARAVVLFSLSQRDHRPVARNNWNARREVITTEYTRWSGFRAADPDWRAYHDAHAPHEQTRWAPEMYRRRAEAARFADQIHDQQQAQRDWKAARQAAVFAQAHNVRVDSGGPPDGSPQRVLAQQQIDREAARRAHDQDAVRAQALQQTRQEGVLSRQSALTADRLARQQQALQTQTTRQAQHQAAVQQQNDVRAVKQAREQQAVQDRAAALQSRQQAFAKQQADAQAARQAHQQQAQQIQAGAREARQQQAAKQRADTQAARQAHQQQAGKQQADAQAARQAQRQQALQSQAAVRDARKKAHDQQVADDKARGGPGRPPR